MIFFSRQDTIHTNNPFMLLKCSRLAKGHDMILFLCFLYVQEIESFMPRILTCFFLLEDEIVHVKNLFSWFYFMFDARNCSRHEIYSWFYLCCRRQTVHTNNPFIFFMFKVSERTWYDPVFMLFQVQGMESFIPRIHSCFFMFKVGIRPC
jgi:hypothetical protein